jgi:hypothetical protein
MKEYKRGKQTSAYLLVETGNRLYAAGLYTQQSENLLNYNYHSSYVVLGDYGGRRGKIDASQITRCNGFCCRMQVSKLLSDESEILDTLLPDSTHD